MTCGKSCGCATYRDHLKSISFSASARPNHSSSQHPLAVDAKEKRLERDLPAYKRLRNDGIQPRHVLGSGDWETKAADRFEIETNHSFGKHLGVAKEVSAALAEDGE